MSTTARLAVALDVTPLLGQRSGVGHFVAEILDAMEAAPGIDLHPYALTLRARRTAEANLPAGTRMLPFPANAAVAAWGRVDQPDAGRWLSPAAVVHGTNFVVPPTGRAGAVVTVHDFTFAKYPELCTPGVRRFGAALRRAVRRGAWVHTPSRFVAAEAVEVLGTDRVVAVPHGVPRLAMAQAPIIGLVGDSPFILALGTLEPRKNIARLVQAFGAVSTRHPDLGLLIAGADGPAKDAVEAAREALPPLVRRRVRLAGYVDERVRSALLAKARVFVYPSLYEGFGFPILEAMAAGTPVVAGQAGAIPEVAGDGALLVDPHDVDGIAEGINRVLDDAALSAELVRSGRRRAAGFTWRTSAAGLADLYHRAAGGS